MSALTVLFALTAALYASVGFGGGSTYTALLLLAGTAIGLVPAISLACNIIVSAGGVIRFGRAGAVPWPRAVPLVALAAPLAFLGGLTPVSEGVLVWLLAFSLLAAAAALLVQPQMAAARPIPRFGLYPAAALIGYLAGVVGIGGGIFLSPLLHLVRWDDARRVAATASLFILTGSLFGLAGQLVKGKADVMAMALASHWPLFVAVLIGGAIGSQVAVRLARPVIIIRLTAVLVGAVAVRLMWQI